MAKIIKIISILFIVISFINSVHAENTFLEDGIKKYNQKKYVILKLILTLLKLPKQVFMKAWYIMLMK